MFVHICCSVDSDFFLKELSKIKNPKSLTAYFYDPNIHPYSEYLLRLSDVKRSCKKLGIPLICGQYDYESWFEGTKGLESEPEKGERCKYCFDFRLENTAKKAKELGFKTITTTLLMSPKKDMEQLKNSLEKICQNYKLDFFAPDFRKNGGTTRQFENAKKEKLYHQNYCGCLYALNMSRKEAHLVELSLPISKQIQPASAPWREKIYKKLRLCEKKGKAYSLMRASIQNYRLEFAKVSIDEKILPSYILFGSWLSKENSNFLIKEKAGLYSAKDNICLLCLKSFNKLAGTNYKSAKELYFNAPSLKQELKVRKKLCGELSINPIIVLDKITPGKFSLSLKASVFNSNIEILDIKK